jgi:hypothetical protein
MQPTGPSESGRPAPSWREMRVMAHVLMRAGLPNFEATESDSSLQPWVEQIDAPYRKRATYFHQFGPVYWQLGALPAELRLSIEPTHPMPDVWGQERRC